MAGIDDELGKIITVVLEKYDGAEYDDLADYAEYYDKAYIYLQESFKALLTTQQQELLDRVEKEVIDAAKVDDDPRGDEFIGIELSTIAVMTRRQRSAIKKIQAELK